MERSERIRSNQVLEGTIMLVISSYTELFSIVLLSFSLFFFGCQSDGQNGSDGSEADVETRERVIDRYSGGEKKVVAVYKGKGTEEELLRRITYAENGERIKVEDKQSGEVKRYEDLHPEYSNPDSLKSYLTRSGWAHSGSVDGTSVSSINVYEDDQRYTFISLGDITRQIVHSVEYLDNFKVLRRTESGEIDTSRVYLLGPSRISYNEELDGEGVHTRVEISDIESEALKNAVKKLETN